jgi:hypothetical protein
MGHIAWGVTSVLLIFVSHRSSAFLEVIRLIVFVTQLTAVLHAGALVSCHSFLSLCLCFNKWSKPGRSLLMSRRVTLLVDSLYICRGNRGCEIARRFIGFYPQLNFDSRRN